MDAKKCDRCGKLYEGYWHLSFNTIELINEQDDDKYLYDTLDLCEQCHDDLKEWLKEGKKENDSKTNV